MLCTQHLLHVCPSWKAFKVTELFSVAFPEVSSQSLDRPYEIMCNYPVSCPSCPVCPSRTRRTLSSLTPWGIFLSCLLVNRHRSTMRQRELRHSPAFPGLTLCPGTSRATLLDLWQSLKDQLAQEQTQSFSRSQWGGSLCLVCLWTLHSAHPPVHAVHGSALTPMTLQMCVYMSFYYLCVYACYAVVLPLWCLKIKIMISWLVIMFLCQNSCKLYSIC